MILHIATFDLIEDVTPDQVRGLTDALERMAAQLPVLRFYVCGENLRLRPGGADFGVAAILDDADGLEAYLGGPEHALVGEQWLSKLVTGRHAVQLELPADALEATAAALRASAGDTPDQ